MELLVFYPSDTRLKKRHFDGPVSLGVQQAVGENPELVPGFTSISQAGVIDPCVAYCDREAKQTSSPMSPRIPPPDSGASLFALLIVAPFVAGPCAVVQPHIACSLLYRTIYIVRWISISNGGFTPRLQPREVSARLIKYQRDGYQRD